MTTSSIERCVPRTASLVFAALLSARAFSTSINVFFPPTKKNACYGIFGYEGSLLSFPTRANSESVSMVSGGRIEGETKENWGTPFLRCLLWTIFRLFAMTCGALYFDFLPRTGLYAARIVLGPFLCASGSKSAGQVGVHGRLMGNRFPKKREEKERGGQAKGSYVR